MVRVRRTRLLSAGRAWAALLALVPGLAAAQTTLRSEVSPGVVAVLDRELALEALPRRSEGLLAFADRLCGGRERSDLVAAANGGARRLQAGIRYRVPYDCLDGETRAGALRALFPADEPRSEGWLHRIPERPSARPSLWAIAERFTGAGENFTAIRRANGLGDESVSPGSDLIIPAALLLRPFRDLVAPLMPAQVLAAAGEPELEYGVDGQGRYALYRLRPGEALYSSVVVRFTGRLFAEDVNPLAEVIARRSDIADVADIPVGYGVKIPLEYLSPEYLPPDHPGRREYDRDRSAAARVRNPVRAAGLRGVTVVLDAGHGGMDVGTATSGIWESLYAYDIMLRVRRVLLQRTAARVFTTTRDGADYRIEDRDILSHSKGHAVLTDPPYPIETARVSANLRWYLSNSLLAKEVANGTDEERVVFLSIHADWLHPSVRGSMVYVPGMLPLPRSYGKSGPDYARRREVQERPRVSFGRSERLRSEGLSRQLAEHLIGQFRRHRLAVHDNKPVRDRIVGRGRPWVPAVLRYNEVPVKVLLEVCNLANEQDLALIKTRAFRQRMAEAIVDGLLSYYDEEPASVGRTAASSR